VSTFEIILKEGENISLANSIFKFEFWFIFWSSSPFRSGLTLSSLFFLILRGTTIAIIIMTIIN
jgi:hypothetical protein